MSMKSPCHSLHIHSYKLYICLCHVLFFCCTHNSPSLFFLAILFRYFKSLSLLDDVVPDACTPCSLLGATTLSSDSIIFTVECNLDICVMYLHEFSLYKTILAKCCSRLFSSILQFYIDWGTQQHVWPVYSSHKVIVSLNYGRFSYDFLLFMMEMSFFMVFCLTVCWQK